jgi:hypothetical protein
MTDGDCHRKFICGAYELRTIVRPVEGNEKLDTGCDCHATQSPRK